MQELSIKVYEFTELPQEIQNKLIQEELKAEYGISYWDYDTFSKDIMADWKSDLQELGFNNAEIKYSGFCSQGDGASFTADVDLAKVVNIDEFCLKYKNRKFFTKAILNHIKCDIVRNSHRYYHSNTVFADIEFKYDSKHCFLNTNNSIHNIISQLEHYINEKQRYYSNKIYKELEKEYYSCYSEEHIKEWFEEVDENLYFIDGTVYNDKMAEAIVKYDELEKDVIIRRLEKAMDIADTFQDWLMGREDYTDYDLEELVEEFNKLKNEV